MRVLHLLYIHISMWTKLVYRLSAKLCSELASVFLPNLSFGTRRLLILYMFPKILKLHFHCPEQERDIYKIALLGVDYMIFGGHI
jgi:hypothetical protein